MAIVYTAETAGQALSVGIHGHPEPANFKRPISTFPAYDPNSNNQWQMDLRSRDLTRFDLSGRIKDLLFADFDSRTQWPSTLPQGFAPQQIMDLGRNPGLGLRRVHEMGITGKGVGLAIIDQPILVNHVEYKDRLRHYEEIHWPQEHSEAQMHGPAVASIAVGKSVGVAPEADLYYLAVLNGQGGKTEADFVFDFTWLAKAIDRILEISATLPAGRKIRVISISVGWSPGQKGYPEVMAAVERAKARGVFIVSSSLEETFGFKFHGLGREPLSDPDAAASYEPGLFWRKSFYKSSGSLLELAVNSISKPQGTIDNRTLLVPMDSRCTASPTGDNDYVFYREGGWSWSIPYLAGLYTMACQVQPDVTPERFWKTALDTGTSVTLNREGKAYHLGTIAQPERLLEKLAQGK